MTLALVLVRWLHLAASVLMASLFLFEAVIFLPATKRTSVGTEHLLDTIHRLTCRTAFWTLLVALLSWFAWSWLAASIMTGDDLIECIRSGDWLTVLSKTQFGYMWLFRVIIILVFGIILWVVGRTSWQRSSLKTFLGGLSVNRACLPRMGWPRCSKCGPVWSRPPFWRCSSSSLLSVLAGSAGASRCIPFPAVKIKPSRSYRAGSASCSPLLSEQRDRGGRYRIYRAIE